MRGAVTRSTVSCGGAQRGPRRQRVVPASRSLSLPPPPLLLLLLWLLSVCLCLCVSYASESTEHYEQAEAVVVWANKLAPHHRPHEVYQFYSAFPACAPKDARRQPTSLGMWLQGDFLVESHYALKFKQVDAKQAVCKQEVSEELGALWRQMVTDDYWYELEIDELPLFVHIGQMNKRGEPTIYSHLVFTVGYNEDQIVSVRADPQDPVAITPGKPVEFYMSVVWERSATEYDERFASYLEPHFFEHRAHWLALLNAALMALFLGFVLYMAMQRTSSSPSTIEDGDIVEEGGYRKLVGDVFRKPARPALLAVLLGTGVQLLVLATIVLLVASGAELYTERGALTQTAIITYFATTFVSGATSGATYLRFGGQRWIFVLLATAAFLPFIAGVVVSSVSIVAWGYGSIRAMPFLSLIGYVALVALVAVPLTAVGTIVGRSFCGTTRVAAKVRDVPRTIPDAPIYARPGVLALLGGLLPFGAAYVEAYFVFAAVFHYKLYYIYGFTLLALMCVSAITAACACVAVLVQLLHENHRWQWTAFGSGFTVGVYLFGSALHYFIFQTETHGFFQTIVFFFYALFLCLVVSLVCSAVGYLAANLFVRRLYHTVKKE